MLCLELMIVHRLRSWPHLLNCVRACMLLLFSFAELQVRILFKGGYYSGCGFYSNKCGMQLVSAPLLVVEAGELQACIMMHQLILSCPTVDQTVRELEWLSTITLLPPVHFAVLLSTSTGYL